MEPKAVILNLDDPDSCGDNIFNKTADIFLNDQFKLNINSRQINSQSLSGSKSHSYLDNLESINWKIDNRMQCHKKKMMSIYTQSGGEVTYMHVYNRNLEPIKEG